MTRIREEEDCVVYQGWN